MRLQSFLRVSFLRQRLVEKNSFTPPLLDEENPFAHSP